MRWFFRIGLGLLLVFLLIVSTFSYLLSTHRGTVFTIEWLQSMLPGELIIQTIEGAFIGKTLRLHQIDYNNPDFPWKISINNLQLNWEASALLHGLLKINSFSVNQLTLIEIPLEKQSIKTVKKQTSIDTFHLPIDLDIRQFQLSDINLLLLDQDPYRISHVILSGQSDNLKLIMQTEKPYNIKLNAQFNVKDSLTWRANIEAKKLDFTQISPLAPNLTNVNLQSQGQMNTNKNQLIATASLKMDQGSLNLHSTIDLKPLKSITQLQSEKFHILDTNDYSVTINSDLHIKQNQDTINITGTFEIPSANIHPIDLSSTITLPDETIIISKTPTEAQRNFPIKTNIQLVLGKNINIDAFGLKSKLSGNLNINDAPGQDTMATGKLQIEQGTFTLFGKTLNIDKGRLLFAGGSVSNPGLEISASKTLEHLYQSSSMFNSGQSLKVGVRIDGSAKRPTVTLFSVPAGLSESDILAYLLFNKPMSQVGASDSTILIQALNSLNHHGQTTTTSLTQDLQTTLGLDELSFGQMSDYDPNTGQTDTHTGVSLGKSLSPDLYVSYSMSVFSQLSLFTVRYNLWRNWSVQATSSTLGTGADLLYSFHVA